MKFKKSTQILFASALILATGVAVYEGTIAPDRQAAKLLQQQVFNFEVDRVATLTVKTVERTLQFDRLPPEEDSTTPRWQFQAIEAAEKSEIQTDPIPAKEAYVSFLLDALVNARSDRTLTVTESELGEYGLDEPQAIVEVKLDDETTHQIQLGERDFSESLVYAIADVPTEETTDFSVLLVSTNLENGINRSLSEWQADEEETSEPQPTPAEDKATEETPPTPQPDASEPPPEASETETTSSEDAAIEETPPTPQPEASEPPPEASETETTPSEDKATEETPPTPQPGASEPPPEASETETTPSEDAAIEETPPTPEPEASEPPPEASETETTPSEDEATEETPPTPEPEASEPPPEASETETTPSEDEAIEATPPDTTETIPTEDEATEETEASSESEQTPEAQTPETTQNLEESGNSELPSEASSDP